MERTLREEDQRDHEVHEIAVFLTSRRSHNYEIPMIVALNSLRDQKTHMESVGGRQAKLDNGVRIRERRIAQTWVLGSTITASQS